MTIKTFRAIAWALLPALLITSTQAADPPVDPKASGDSVAVEVFQDARPLTAPGELAYPETEKERGREGWAMLNMMIDPKGKPYEISILDSSGNAALEQAAIKAVHRLPECRRVLHRSRWRSWDDVRARTVLSPAGPIRLARAR